MERWKPTGGVKPETKIQRALIQFLELRGWLVKATHGSAASLGWPDLFATHAEHGARWIEVKKPERRGQDMFEHSQWEFFSKLCAHGSGVWVITAATETEYRKLFKSQNYTEYMLKVLR